MHTQHTGFNSTTRSSGRFFAANELKAMLAYIILHYDIKLAKPGERPADMSLGATNMPNPKAEIMLRWRE